MDWGVGGKLFQKRIVAQGSLLACTALTVTLPAPFGNSYVHYLRGCKLSIQNKGIRDTVKTLQSFYADVIITSITLGTSPGRPQLRPSRPLSPRSCLADPLILVFATSLQVGKILTAHHGFSSRCPRICSGSASRRASPSVWNRT